jgi:hypothetical protein
MPHVERDRLQHVVAQSARVVELRGRDADAFLPDLGGAGIVGAVSGAADVVLMRAVDGPEDELPSQNTGRSTVRSGR